MNDDRKAQTTLNAYLRTIGYEVENGDGDGAVVAKLDGSQAYIIIGYGEAHLHDVSVNFDKAARILAILAEPEFPVVDMVVFGMDLAKALGTTDACGIPGVTEIGLSGVKIEIKARPRGDATVIFAPPDLGDGYQRTVAFARTRALTIVPGNADLAELAADIKARVAEIMAVANNRGVHPDPAEAALAEFRTGERR